MTTLPDINTTTITFSEWLEAVRVSIVRQGRAKGMKPEDANDLAQEVVLKLIEAGPSIMERYPRPQTYASVRFRHARIDMSRKQRVQAGCGVKGRRYVYSYDESFGDGQDGQSGLDAPMYAGVNLDPRGESDWCHTIDVNEQLADLRHRLTEREYRWVMDTKGHGMTVTEVAERDGVARETVSRVVNASVRRVQITPPC